MVYQPSLLQKAGICLIFVLVSCTNILVPTVPVVRGLADKGDVGESAYHLLASERYRRMAVEIQFAPGMKPQDGTIHNFLIFLKKHLDKPGGITVTLKQVGTIQKTKITTQDADSFAVKNRVLYTEGDLIALYIYFADAISAKSWIGGVAFRNTSLIVFEKTILDNLKGSGTASLVKMETGVLEHETAHLLGLVNNGTPMITAHEDPSNKFHCSNRNCLMYHAMESTGLLNAAGKAVPLLDANCIRDLKAHRQKQP